MIHIIENSKYTYIFCAKYKISYRTKKYNTFNTMLHKALNAVTNINN